ncbi:MAG: hypothetical protein KNN14_09290 [Aquificota bacterium]|nr:MAG: hypothetical protein KNN14_09290 [Aquificota bacterium]
MRGIREALGIFRRYRVALFLLLFVLTASQTALAENKGTQINTKHIKWLDFSATKYSYERNLVRELEKEDIEEAEKLTKQKVEILIALEDINGDGIMDVIAYFYHTYYCGSLGCFVEIYINKKGQLSPINFAFVLPEPKIGIIKSKSYGWYDLIVMDSNGNYRKLKWNGKEYK